jgi:hypothetical protein
VADPAWWHLYASIFLSETTAPSDIHPELTLTCHGFVLFFAGKLCAAAYVTQKKQPFAAMLPVLPFGVLRLSDRAWSMIPKKPAPDLIRGGDRFSEEIMLKQETRP